VKLLENDAKIARESLYNSWTLGCSDFDILFEKKRISCILKVEKN
jgi:hypothetical protein